MFSTLVQKELQAIMLSPKFAVTFLVSTCLMLLSVYIGIQEYRSLTDQYNTAVGLAQQEIEEASSWASVYDRAYRQPDPMQIFASGLNYDIGRWSRIDTDETVRLRNSAYSDDPLFAVFRFVDFAFIMLVVMSLLAILFTYDAINGEREEGALRLVFSNAVPRARYIIAKCTGIWLGLVIPICLSIALGVLLVMLYAIPMTASHWGRLTALIAVSLLFFTFFIVLGILISTLTRRPSVSFLVALVVWVAMVFIIPRAGVMAAGVIIDVPRVAEIDGQRDAFAKSKWQVYNQDRAASRADDEQAEGSCAVQNEEALWARLEEEHARRRVIEQEIEAHELRLMEDLQRRKEAQERLGFALTRVSPASAYQLAAMALAGSDITLKSRYEDAMRNYRTTFVDYVKQKTGDGPLGAVAISLSSDGSMSIATSRDNELLDISDRPRFVPPELTLAAAMDDLIIDVGVLLLATIIAYAAAFVAFLRYDVR
jgi:ABC-type transport system involved in multi-copper enzyme maturation permease subunit